MSFVAAIRNRLLVSFTYDGLPRVVQPATYGYTTAGNLALRACLVHGQSKRYTLPCWELDTEAKMVESPCWTRVSRRLRFRTTRAVTLPSRGSSPSSEGRASNGSGAWMAVAGRALKRRRPRRSPVAPEAEPRECLRTLVPRSRR